MTTIGTFTQQNDSFIGTLRTLTINVKVKIIPIEKAKENAPDYRILAGQLDIGAAWKKTAHASQRDYLSVALDDPSFPNTLYARLVQNEVDAGHSLIWSRTKSEYTQRDTPRECGAFYCFDNFN